MKRIFRKHLAIERRIGQAGVALAMNRREFFQTTAGAALVASSLNSSSTEATPRFFRTAACSRSIALMAMLGLWLLLPLAARAEDWPQWRGPNRDAVWHEAGILQTFPAQGLNFIIKHDIKYGLGRENEEEEEQRPRKKFEPVV